MENQRKNPSLCRRGIGDSLKILRASRALYPPFSAGALETRFDLLHLPFLDGVNGLESRIERLQHALRLVADFLSGKDEIVYREVFLEPQDEVVGTRVSSAAEKLARSLGPYSEATPKNAQKINETLPQLVAQILLSSELEQRLNEEAPIERKRNDNAASDVPSIEPYEILDYKCDCDIDDDDPRELRELRKIGVRIVLPHQRIVGMRYYTACSPATPIDDEVRVLSRGHSYLGTRSDAIEGSPSDWWMHFIHLGRRRELGEEITVEMAALYFDYNRGNSRPFVSMTVRFESLKVIELGLRLPASKRKEVEPVARVIVDPFDQRRIMVFPRFRGVNGA